MSKRLSRIERTALAEFKRMPTAPKEDAPVWLKTPDGEVFSDVDAAAERMHLLNLAAELQEKFGGETDRRCFPSTAIAKWLVSRYEMELK